MLALHFDSPARMLEFAAEIEDRVEALCRQKPKETAA